MDTINTNFDNWGTYILKQFQYMYERGEQCDFQISCDKKVVLVHRIVMSACSDYIKDLEHSQKITLPDQVSYRILKRVIDFIYSGKIIFHKDEKDELLLTANLLNLKLLEELIKTEESIPYTLQLDDDEVEYDDNKTVEKIDNDPLQVSIMDTTENQNKNSVEKKETKRRAPKRKSDKKNSKKNSILPPLHTFPFLQQKFSAARTYGLIPSMSNPIPSRFTMPDQELQSCGYRATFDNITFDSCPLYNDSDNFIAMDEKHHDFLKKQRHTTHGISTNKRNTMYANTLYSPFDKFQPAMKRNDLGKMDMISYPAKSSIVGGKNDQTTTATFTTTTDTASEIPSESYELLSKTSEDMDLVAIPKAGATFGRPSPTKKRVRFSDDVDIEVIRPIRTDPGEAEITAQALSEAMSILPEPIKPCEIVQGHCEMANESGDTIELLNLDNSNIYGTHHAQMDSIKSSSTSITELINCDFEDDTEILTEEANAVNGEKINEIDEEPQQLLPPDGTIDKFVNNIEEPISGELDENDTDLIPTNLFPLSVKNDPKAPNKVKRLILKVKGNETPEQISELVGMCKQNSIFKDKSNLRFKFVTVKGGVGSNASTLSVPVVSTSSSVLLKQLTTTNTKFSTVVTTCSAAERNSVIKNGAADSIKKKQGTVENVSGPWTCNECKNLTSSSENKAMKFDSYLEYRNHIHAIHNVPESTVYCKYCGFKATKRNYQLFHLLTKHNVQPPANISFPKCGQCDNPFLSDAFLQKHIANEHSLMREEQAKYVCSCNKSFGTNELLNRHKASGDCKKPKTFSCGYCPTIFDRYVNLKAHVRICMKEKAKP